MDYRKLTKISFVVALLGIILIVLLALNLEPTTRAISSISEKNLDEWVKIQGKVIDIKEIKSNETEIFDIIRVHDGMDSIDVLSGKVLDLKINYEIEVIGKVSEYKGELQIEASKIKEI